MYIDGKLSGSYQPDFDTFPNLEHPPVKIDNIPGVWGGEWHDGELKGFVDGENVINRRMSKKPIPTHLWVKADDQAIHPDGIDVTRVEVRAVDQLGNIMPFYFMPIEITVSGGATLLGANLVSLQGGVYAFWVRSNSLNEDIKIRVEEKRLGISEIMIKTLTL